MGSRFDWLSSSRLSDLHNSVRILSRISFFNFYSSLGYTWLFDFGNKNEDSKKEARKMRALNSGCNFLFIVLLFYSFSWIWIFVSSFNTNRTFVSGIVNSRMKRVLCTMIIVSTSWSLVLGMNEGKVRNGPGAKEEYDLVSVSWRLLSICLDWRLKKIKADQERCWFWLEWNRAAGDIWLDLQKGSQTQVSDCLREHSRKERVRNWIFEPLKQRDHWK